MANTKQFSVITGQVTVIHFLLAAALLMGSFTANAEGLAGERFTPSDDVVAEVSEASRTARQENKQVLVIMGANWCHDSRALAARVDQEPLKSVIDRHYVTVFVDVGFFEISPSVVASLGTPVYYATPSVLILDPISGALVNAENRHQWGHADTISMEDSVAYFESMAKTQGNAKNGEATPSIELQGLFDQIDAFQQEQADRLYRAYAVIGPKLRAYKDGQSPPDFEDTWNEVRDFRMQVPADVDALRSQAETRVSDGKSGIELDFPEYPAFSWETEAGR